MPEQEDRPRVGIGVIIVNHDGKVLIGKRKGGHAPYYSIPGGQLDLGETFEAGAIREVKEETGIEAEIEKSLGFDEDFEPDKHGEITHYIFLVYKAKYISGELKPDDDIEKLEWISKEKLSQIELNRPAVKLFKGMGY
ncbi:MAG: NUDIX domain-containing protein, partial [Candidatus Pacebacteria bacterium]|nr:NUDIX domain-containing protein [Candidatus Paceibacterota bacterium]